MILWLDGGHDASENMRRDTALLAGLGAGHPAVLRLYAFAPAGITLGANQDPARELDLEACARDGIRVAVRPTGGGAIYHAAEWTYALAAPLDDRHWGGSVRPACARIARWLVASLNHLGVPAGVAPAGPATSGGPRAAAGPAAPCFATTARHEIVLDGRKLIGSAQRRTRAGLLQQGSLRLGAGHERLADYLRLPAPDRAAWRDRLTFGVALAGPHLAAQAGLEQWAAALRATAPVPLEAGGGGLSDGAGPGPFLYSAGAA